MIGRHFRTLMLLLLPLLLVACSRTTIDSAWKDPAFQGKVRTVYVIGISKNDTNRRIFEDEFSRQLQQHGAVGIPSYNDLLAPADASKETVAELMRKNGADSVLMTRLLDKRTEQVVNPGRVSGYWSSGYPYTPSPYYSNWGGYYDRRYELIYEPATVTRFVVATIEANLYELQSGKLIWSAQLETMLDGNRQKLIDGFATVVINDLRKRGLL